MKTVTALLLQPAAIMSMIVLIGLLIQKKPFSAVITGTVKSLVGFEMIIAGGRIISDSTQPLMEMLTHGFNIQGTILNEEAATGMILEEYGIEISLVMILGLLCNLVLARITRFHYVFMTGHQSMYMAALIVCVLRSTGVEGAAEITLGAFLAGVVMILSPAVTQTFTRRICRSDKAALGHFSSFSYLIAAIVGKIFGDTDHSAEKLRIPGWLSFIRDTSVILFLAMSVLNLIAATAAGREYVQSDLSGGQDSVVFAVIQAVYFTIGFTVITTGVRWLVDEIVPAVRGISQVWVPNAVPTIDCPLVFPYSPNALVLGFIASFLGGMASMWFMIACGLPVIIPGVVPHFFCGATAGIYANSTGGTRGAALGGFVNGILISFLPMLALPHMGALGTAGVSFADTDFCIVAILLSGWLERVGVGGSFIILFCIVALMILVPETVVDREKEIPWFIQESNKGVYDSGDLNILSGFRDDTDR